MTNTTAAHPAACRCLTCELAVTIGTRHAACGNTYGDTDVVCTLPDGHAGDHTAPTGDDDGVWAWA
jgi:hypothetical protein